MSKSEFATEAKREASKAAESMVDIYDMVKVETLVQTDRLIVLVMDQLGIVHKKLLHKIKEELPKNRRHTKIQAEA